MNRENELKAFERLLDIMDELRVKCPWDKVQTTESLRPMTIEETYELSDAILAKDDKNISKELGDILLHIVFYAKIGKEEGKFDITDVINLLCEKLIYRHPHVFSTTQVSGAGEVVRNWEALKRTEKDGNKTVLSGVPNHLPPLLKAYRMQDKARAVGFDWEKKEDVWEKVAEELGEFKEELEMPDEHYNVERVQNELGDLLFSIVNAARMYDLNPDTALENTCIKFKNRFTYIEQKCKEKGVEIKSLTLAQMDEIWDEAKSKGL
ncbi:MAG: nucleoside triphosphate pyrophosphohydrolase [Bacteroidales bacterium]|nr:nucleoside triphosphate pyrophosphohydrolase [Bacteroidales bacterium]MDD3201504.1 nucleoside triphosphate pyrophosphohydrolase [Bacteroidales bacterium]